MIFMYNLLVQINAFGACAIQRIALIMVATKQKETQTMITAEQAKDLAVSYAAFLTANDKGDSKEMAFWAQSLLDAQRETGVQMLRPENLEFWIELILEDQKRPKKPKNKD